MWLVKEEDEHERNLKEKMSREKDKYMTAKFRLESELRVGILSLNVMLDILSEIEFVPRCD